MVGSTTKTSRLTMMKAASDDRARSAILSHIATRLAESGERKQREARVQSWADTPPQHPIPAIVQASQQEWINQFIAKAKTAGAELVRLRQRRDLPDAAAAIGASQHHDHKSPAGPILLAPGSPHADVTPIPALDWGKAGLSTAILDREPFDDVTIVTEALAGIAETGSLVLYSGKGMAITANFLASHHLVLLHEAMIVPTLEQGWDCLHQHRGERLLPRMVNLVTGPSRTGDIEQSIELGAHGPLRLTIFLYQEP
ncbi:MAG: LUD domain-containing protein [Pseudomonadota bacterium]